MGVLAYLLARFSEPSSYAGLGALFALCGWQFSDTTIGQLIQFLAAGCGLAALLLRERGLVPALILALAVSPLLTACGGLVAAGSAAGAAATALSLANAVSGPVDDVIATACGEYQKGKTAADAIAGLGLLPAGVTTKMSSIESFGDAACADPPPTDPLSTAIWLGQLAGQITTLASGAKPGAQSGTQAGNLTGG